MKYLLSIACLLFFLCGCAGPEQFAYINGKAPFQPGIFLASLGDNRELFLNGFLIKSEMHLDENGQVRSGRGWRHVSMPLDRSFFVPGTNILAFRIVGKPHSVTTDLMNVLLGKSNLNPETTVKERTRELERQTEAAESAALARELEFASKEGKGDAVKKRHGELRGEPDRELLERLSAATGRFNSNETEEALRELERYRYERGEDLIVWLREQAENFDYDAIHKRLGAKKPLGRL